MSTQAFGILLAVFNVLTAIAIALIMQRFGRLEDRVDSIDILIYERSRELAALAEGQKQVLSAITEHKQDQAGYCKELQQDLKGISNDVRKLEGLVRYGERQQRSE